MDWFDAETHRSCVIEFIPICGVQRYLEDEELNNRAMPQ
jgi:hypothetical protein